VINLNLFPSKRLALYLVRLFLTRSFAVLFALVLVLMTLDLLGESGKILAVPGNGDKDLWHYVILRIPLLVSRFLPFAVLLGTLIAFVEMTDGGDAAIAALSGAEVEGRALTVNEAKPREPRTGGHGGGRGGFGDRS